MSNISLIIGERARDIGKFMVGRLLPFRQKRMVGPFIYIDHMGPVELDEAENFDVPPHPHIGLSTLTFLFEGHIMHRDTLGNTIEIKPGEVNWMTAGKGIVHSERTPNRLRNSKKTMHGLQIWVALPKHLEQMDPEFFHISDDEIPTWKDGDLSFKLVAGKALGKKSPVPVYSDLYMIEIKSQSKTKVNIGDALYGESGLYILEGAVVDGDIRYESRQILIAKDSKLCAFEMEANTTVYIFGGEALSEERHIEWNFVATEKKLIEAAKTRWQNHDFPKIAGDDDYVPLPGK